MILFLIVCGKYFIVRNTTSLYITKNVYVRDLWGLKKIILKPVTYYLFPFQPQNSTECLSCSLWHKWTTSYSHFTRERNLNRIYVQAWVFLLIVILVSFSEVIWRFWQSRYKNKMICLVLQDEVILGKWTRSSSCSHKLHSWDSQQHFIEYIVYFWLCNLCWICNQSIH